MNIRFMISMGVAIIGLAVGFYLLNDIQQEKTSEITQKSLDLALHESNQRLSIVKDEFYNGKYNGELSKEEVIKIINDEVKTQKNILEQYKALPKDKKTDKTIDMRFFQLGKYYWAGEDSMLQTLKKSP
ncbi:MAG: hypothetical protein OEL69_04735 [Nitrosopumilus sp.]|jgi:predicted RNA methylase|nr:hypothetical protein [Nitrosopumilus sp.]